jgi:PhnB protein
MATNLVPYIFFYGRCEEALEFYKSVFGGTYEMMRVSDTPMASEMPPDSGNRVMHASFTADGVAFMASDGRDSKAVDPDAGNISLSLSFDDAATGERIFNALAEGGKIGMPIDKAFWGGRFGMLTDKFGSEWMVVLP